MKANPPIAAAGTSDKLRKKIMDRFDLCVKDRPGDAHDLVLVFVTAAVALGHCHPAVAALSLVCGLACAPDSKKSPPVVSDILRQDAGLVPGTIDAMKGADCDTLLKELKVKPIPAKVADKRDALRKALGFTAKPGPKPKASGAKGEHAVPPKNATLKLCVGATQKLQQRSNGSPAAAKAVAAAKAPRGRPATAKILGKPVAKPAPRGRPAAAKTSAKSAPRGRPSKRE